MSESKLVGVNVSEARAAFVDKAAKAFIAAGHGTTKADFLRSVVDLHAKRQGASVLANDPSQKLLAAVTAELVARGLL